MLSASSVGVSRRLAGRVECLRYGLSCTYGRPTVDCVGETRCKIAYTVQEPVGFMNDVELILPTRQIWKAIFTDPQFRNGTITVSGPVKAGRGKETSVFFFRSREDRLLLRAGARADRARSRHMDAMSSCACASLSVPRAKRTVCPEL